VNVLEASVNGALKARVEVFPAWYKSSACCQLGLYGALHYQFGSKYGGNNWKFSNCSCSFLGLDSGLSLPF
jgi:hypothetical protein